MGGERRNWRNGLIMWRKWKKRREGVYTRRELMKWIESEECKC